MKGATLAVVALLVVAVAVGLFVLARRNGGIFADAGALGDLGGGGAVPVQVVSPATSIGSSDGGTGMTSSPSSSSPQVAASVPAGTRSGYIVVPSGVGDAFTIPLGSLSRSFGPEGFAGGDVVHVGRPGAPGAGFILGDIDRPVSARDAASLRDLQNLGLMPPPMIVRAPLGRGAVGVHVHGGYQVAN
jgi:hypothetical protein